MFANTSPPAGEAGPNPVDPPPCFPCATEIRGDQRIAHRLHAALRRELLAELAQLARRRMIGGQVRAGGDSSGETIAHHE